MILVKYSKTNQMGDHVQFKFTERADKSATTRKRSDDFSRSDRAVQLPWIS